ncbi:ArpU family transcriptional regulator [Erwinia sp. CPCC 100877]|nr:ArpU family transcriptional regulator [Erwinia sp. CPCC 100877]
MIVFPEIDRKQTKKKVHQLLNNYRSLARIAGELHVPKLTTAYTFEMNEAAGTIRQNTEQSFNRKEIAEAELKKITAAFNQLEEQDRQLLYDKYIDHNFTTNIAIYMKLHMSESKFYRELDRVLICFAEVYENGELLIEK